MYTSIAGHPSSSRGKIGRYTLTCLPQEEVHRSRGEQLEAQAGY